MPSSSQISSQLTHIQNQTNRVNYDRGQENLGSDKLDKHAFLQLMMTQLQLQSPLNPMDNSAFLEQQASLAQVEKLDDLVSLLQGNSLLTQAGALVGKDVAVQNMDGSVTTGKIESVNFSDGTASITIDGEPYPMNSVIKMFAETPAEGGGTG